MFPIIEKMINQFSLTEKTSKLQDTQDFTSVVVEKVFTFSSYNNKDPPSEIYQLYISQHPGFQ